MDRGEEEERVWSTIGVSSCHFHPLVSREPVHAHALAKLRPISHAHSYGQEGSGHSQRAHNRDIGGQGVWHKEGRSRDATTRITLISSHSHGPQPWGTAMGRTAMGHRHGARPWGTAMGHSHGAQPWGTAIRGAQPWGTAQHSPRANTHERILTHPSPQARPSIPNPSLLSPAGGGVEFPSLPPRHERYHFNVRMHPYSCAMTSRSAGGGGAWEEAEVRPSSSHSWTAPLEEAEGTMGCVYGEGHTSGQQVS